MGIVYHTLIFNYYKITKRKGSVSLSKVKKKGF